MGKTIAAVVVGFIAWSAIHFGNMAGVRAFWSEAFGEDGSCFETAPLAVILGITFVQSIIAGFVCRLIDRRGRGPAALAVALVLVGIAIEGAGWELAPAWFHIAFVVMLAPMTLLGAKLAGKKPA